MQTASGNTVNEVMNKAQVLGGRSPSAIHRDVLGAAWEGNIVSPI